MAIARGKPASWLCRYNAVSNRHEHVIFRKRLHRVSRIPIIQLVRVNVVGEDVAELSDGITLVV